MNRDQNKNRRTGFLNETSLAVALTLSMAAQVFAPAATVFAAPAGQEAEKLLGRDQSAPMKFEQRAASGMLNMMAPEEKMKVPLSKWVEYLPDIVGHNEYGEIPSKIEALIPLAEYYKDRSKRPPLIDAVIQPSIIDMLIQHGHLGKARAEVRNSVTYEYLTNKQQNGYMLLADILAKGEWNDLSAEVRGTISKNHDLWVNPVAVAPGAGGEVMRAPVTIAALNNYADAIPDEVLNSMASHQAWDSIKRDFLIAAVETRQMGFLKRLANEGEAFWKSFTDNDLIVRDGSESNLIDRFAETGQAHLLPETFWKSLGIDAFTAVHPRTKLTPLYLIAFTEDAAKKLTPGQMEVIHQASKKDWLFEDMKLVNAADKNAGVTAFFNAMYFLQPELLGEKVWSELTREEVVRVRGDGHPLSFWIGNAGAADRIGGLLNEKEKSELPKPGSVAAKAVAWNDIEAARKEIELGIVNKARLLKVGPDKKTMLSTIIRMVPNEEIASKLIPPLTFEELTKVEGERNEFPLLNITDVGLLKYVSDNVWSKIVERSDILTRKADDGRFILNVAAKDRHNNQLGVLSRKGALDKLPRQSFFVRDDMGGFPFFWAHFSAQEDALPLGTGKFSPHDILISAPGKGDSLTHVYLRDESIKKKRRDDEKKRIEALKEKGIFNEEEYQPLTDDFDPGNMKKVLERFPFETWRSLDERGETAILKLARNGETRFMPKEFHKQITVADAEFKSPHYGDTPFYWWAGEMFAETKDAAVVWHHTPDLLQSSVIEGIKPEVWTDPVRSAAEDDPNISEQTRHALKREDFALIGSVRIGYLPPSSYRWTEAALMQQDVSGIKVVQELDRQRKMDKDRLHDLARLGLLDKDKIPPYIMIQHQKDWEYKPSGALHSIFEEAVLHNQFAAADWGNTTGKPVLPVEMWYRRGTDSLVPIVHAIHSGNMEQVPAGYLYDSPQFWTEQLLTEVYDAGKWRGNAAGMMKLWKEQTRHIDVELTVAAEVEMSTDRRAMLEEKAALYKSFAPIFEKNYKMAGGGTPVAPSPALQ
jgi:hypothetical protein